MKKKDINDEERWNAFVNRLVTQTHDEELEWEDCRERAKRPRAIGPIFLSEILPGKFVAAYRYEYNYYTDSDEYETRRDIAIELVDENCRHLWTLPEVPARYKLIDILEFGNADAGRTLDDFLGS